MKGRVVSVVSTYGFIDGEDGKSYYFNADLMHSEHKFSQIEINAPVEFESKAGPRGMMAKGVFTPVMYSGVQLTDTFLHLRLGKQPRAGLVFDHDRMVAIQSQWFDSPQRAIDELTQVVVNEGANCLMDGEMLKCTFREGNYHHTRHSYAGRAGLYGHQIWLDDFDEASRSVDQAFEYSESLSGRLRMRAENLDKVRESQERGSGLVILVIVVCVLIGLFVFSQLG